MRSNHLVLLILSVIMTSAAASATPLLDRLQHVVDLTESQISQLREAEEHVAAVVRRVELAVRSGSLSPADGRVHIQAARQDLVHRWQEVLSDEQLARWRHSLETNRDSDRATDRDTDRVTDRVTDRAPNRDSDRSSTPLLSRLLHVLDLSESQITQLREAEERVDAVSHRVVSAVHSGSLSPEDGRAHIQAARQDLEGVWQKVLSEQQLARWRRSLETDRRQDSDAAADGTAATENPQTAPTAVKEWSWGQIKREMAR